MNKASMISRIIRAGKAADLLHMMEGISTHVTERSSGVPDNAEERKAWIIALNHLRFLAEFGDQPSIEKDGRYLTPYPEDFEHWIQLGAPGIATEDLQDYMRHNSSELES